MSKILVIGANGMLGFALHRILADRGHDVVGTVRGAAPPDGRWTRGLRYRCAVDVEVLDTVRRTIAETRASVVINAAGVIKQVAAASDASALYRINAAFPRRLALAAAEDGFRLIHFSTDCVFAGTRGGYRESDVPDAQDAYGLSKFLGEPAGPETLTLRTSIIGRGIVANGSLVDWYLAQRGTVRGYSRAIFSGLPVDAVARFVDAHVLPNLPRLTGLYHLAAEPVDKARLLSLVGAAWGAGAATVVPDDGFAIDRSLDATRLLGVVPHTIPDWPRLIADMHSFYAALAANQSTA